MASSASEIITYLTNNKYYMDKCSKVVEHLSAIMYATNFGQPQSRESMWHKIIVNNEDRSLHNYFSDTLLEISKHSHAVESGLLFHSCERIIKEVISRNVKKKEIATKETLPISKKEEQILYYVPGYITFSMIEKYKRIINNNEKNITAKDALKFSNSLKKACFDKIVGTLLEDYVERWIEIPDRDGLVKADEEFYSFVLKIVEVARSFMTVDLLRRNQKENMKEIFKVKLKTVPEVSAICVSLSRKKVKQTIII